MKNIFLTPKNKIRNIIWVAIFFALLTVLLFPTILIAQQYSLKVSMPVQAILIVLVTVICQFLRREPVAVITGRFNLKWLKQLLIGLTIGAIMMLLPAFILGISGIVEWEVNKFSFHIIFSTLQKLVFGALVEELLFRGFIFQRLMESLGLWPAQFIIGGLFLLTHFNNPGMTGMILLMASINIFVASILFGMAFTNTRSLAMSLGIHFMANSVQGTLLGFGISGNQEPSILSRQTNPAPEWITGGNFGLEASLPGLVILLLITGSFFIWCPAKKWKSNK